MLPPNSPKEKEKPVPAGGYIVLIESRRTISPLRMKKMQENQFEAQSGTVSPVIKGKEESESEADRALTVVAKKLSKTLSVGATVNELIQQASDERNLSLLYSGGRPSPHICSFYRANESLGWAAYA